MTGRSILITGARQGIGLACARTLAADPDLHLLIAARDPGRARAIAETLGPRVGVVSLDLVSLANIREGAAALRGASGAPHALPAMRRPPVACGRIRPRSSGWRHRKGNGAKPHRRMSVGGRPPCVHRSMGRAVAVSRARRMSQKTLQSQPSQA